MHPGTQIRRANLTFLLILLMSDAKAQISSSILTPARNALVTMPNLMVSAEPRSTFQIKEVRAKVGNRETVLALGASNRYTGHIDLTGFPVGDLYVVVLTTDVLDNSHTDSSRFFWGDTIKPELTVKHPRNEIGAIPEMRIKANCKTATGAKCKLTVDLTLGNTHLIAKEDSVDEVFNMAKLFPNSQVGSRATLKFSACDEYQRCVHEDRAFTIDSSEYLKEVAGSDEVFGACNRDYCYSKNSSTWALTVFNVHSGTKRKIPPSQFNTGVATHAYLTPAGGMFFLTNPAGLSYWYDGAVSILADNVDRYKVAGNYIAWTKDKAVKIKKVSEGTVSIVNMGNDGVLMDLRSDGTEIYAFSDSLFRVTPEGSTLIVNHPGYRFSFALGDKFKTVYSRANRIGLGPWEYTLAVFDGTAETILMATGVDEIPEAAVQYNNGWIAYKKVVNIDLEQVWLRNPAGEEKQATLFSTSSTLRNLAPNGEITINYNNRTYLVDGTGSPRKISGLNPHEIWQDGKWYTSIGSSLFEVTPRAAPTIAFQAQRKAGGDPVWNEMDRQVEGGWEMGFAYAGTNAVHAGLFDHLGRKIRELTIGESETGSRAVFMPTGSLGRGVYHLLLRGRGFTTAKRIAIADK